MLICLLWMSSITSRALSTDQRPKQAAGLHTAIISQIGRPRTWAKKMGKWGHPQMKTSSVPTAFVTFTFWRNSIKDHSTPHSPHLLLNLFATSLHPYSHYHLTRKCAFLTKYRNGSTVTNAYLETTWFLLFQTHFSHFTICP